MPAGRPIAETLLLTAINDGRAQLHDTEMDFGFKSAVAIELQGPNGKIYRRGATWRKVDEARNKQLRDLLLSRLAGHFKRKLKRWNRNA